MTRRFLALTLVLALAPAALSACSGRSSDAGTTVTPGNSPASPPALATTPPGTIPGTPTAAATPTATATAAPSPEPPGPPAFEADRALEAIRQLTVSIGTREAGGPGERAAVDYIAGRFRSYGYTVEIMPFTYSGDRYRTGRVVAGEFSTKTFTMAGSAGGAVTAPAAYVGIGDAAAYAGKDLRGRIAIADRGQLTFAEKVQAATAAGALALVVVNDQPGDFIGNAGVGVTLPVVGVAQDAGEALRAAAQSGVQLLLEAAGLQTTSWNVIARPAAGAACAMLVGAHQDTVAGVVAALDNASGTATTLELARAFAADGLDPGLCFATFGAEESGLFGSKALADRMAAAGALPKAFVNLDMTGLGERVDLIGADSLVQQAGAIAAGLNIAAAPTQLGPFYGSDHQSFQAVGVPIIMFTTSELGQLHTPNDTIDTIDQAALARSGRLVYAFIAAVLPKVA